MRTRHRESRAGQHRPEYREYASSRRSRHGSSTSKGRNTLLSVVAFLAVGAIAVWSAVGFNTDANDAGVSVAGASTSRSGGNTATPVVDTSPTAGTGGVDTPSSSEKAEQTKYGPLSAADKDFLDKVFQAGAWEGPTGRQAQERAASKKVKDVGLTLAADHAQLDSKVTAVAQALGHTLPDGPSQAQQGWMNELSQVQGEEYDKLFADRLRAAHGKVFAVIADIRAGTKNGLIRQFAQTANAAVLKHMTILESTGFVNFSELPDAKNPTQAVPPSAAKPSTGSSNGQPGTGGNQFGQDLSQDQTLTPAASTTRNRDGGVDNTIIVIMLAVAGVISAITYRQLHRRRS